MSDLETFFLVLAVIYLVECVFWVRRDCVGFLALTDQQCRLISASSLPGNDLGGLLLGNPFPPLGAIYICQAWPVSISPVGVYSYIAQTVNPGDRPAQPAGYVRFEEIHTVADFSKETCVNVDTFVKVGSTKLASYLADLLRRLSTLSTEERGEKSRLH